MTLAELAALLSFLPVAPTDAPPVQFVPECGAIVFTLDAGPGDVVESGRKVSLQYRVVDDAGRELASTRRRGMIYSMVLGQPKNEPVLEALLAGARYGERRIAFCSSQEAYGADGVPAIVPKDKPLTFELQVLLPPGFRPTGRQRRR
jgi:FKBP-type peptidyl-prolyl cis-trans isomerase